MNKIQKLYYTFNPSTNSYYETAYGLFMNYNSYADPLFVDASAQYRDIKISQKIANIMIVIAGCSITLLLILESLVIVYSFSALRRKNKLFRLLLSVKPQHISSLIKDAKDFNDYLFHTPEYLNTMQSLEIKDNVSIKDQMGEKQKNEEESQEEQKQENRIESISLSKYKNNTGWVYAKSSLGK